MKGIYKTPSFNKGDEKQIKESPFLVRVWRSAAVALFPFPLSSRRKPSRGNKPHPGAAKAPMPCPLTQEALSMNSLWHHQDLGQIISTGSCQSRYPVSWGTMTYCEVCESWSPGEQCLMCPQVRDAVLSSLVSCHRRQGLLIFTTASRRKYN